MALQQQPLPKEYTDVVLARREGPFVWPEAPRYEQTKLPKKYLDAVSKVKKPRKTPKTKTLQQGKMDAFVRKVSEAEFSLLLGAEKVTAPANTEFVFFSPDGSNYEDSGAKIRRGEEEVDIKPYNRPVTIPRELRFGGGPFGAMVFRRTQSSPYRLHDAKVDILFEDGHLIAIGTAEISIAKAEVPIQFPITAQLFDVAVSSALVADLRAAVANEPVHYQRLWDIATRYASLFRVPGLSQHLDNASLIPRQRRPRGERSFLWIHTRMSHMGMTLDNWDFDNPAIVVIYTTLAGKIMGYSEQYGVDLTLARTLLTRTRQMGWSHLLHLFIFTQFMNDDTASTFYDRLTTHLRESGHTWFTRDASDLICQLLSVPSGKTFIETFPWKIDNSGARPKPVRYAYVYDYDRREGDKERRKDWFVALRTRPDYLPMQIDYAGEWPDEEDEETPYFDLSWATQTFFILKDETLYAVIVTYTQWQPEIVSESLRIEIHFDEDIPRLPTGFEKLEDLRRLSAPRENEILSQEDNEHPLVQCFIKRMIHGNSPANYPFNDWLKEYGYASHKDSHFRTADLSERLDKVLVKNWFPREYDALYGKR
jgi:hypothetical protein